MNEPCPSNYALDAFRLGLDAAVSAHVKVCARCTAWLGEQDRLEAGVAGLWMPAAPKRQWLATRRLRNLLGFGLPLAVAATVLLLLALPKPPPEIAKGNALGVRIGRSNGDAVSWLSTTDRLSPNDAIRFFVNGIDARDRYVLIGSVDGSRRLFRFYPAGATACSVAVPPAGQALDGSIVIDDAPGPERIAVVFSHQPLCWPAVSEAVKRFALGEPLTAELDAADVHATLLTFAKQPGAAP